MALPGASILPLPSPPDFLLCSPAYGDSLATLDCLHASNDNMLEGSTPISWKLGGGPSSSLAPYLPVTYSYGRCWIQITFSHYQPSIPTSQTRDLWIQAIPNDLRSLAARIIQRCVTLQGGIGGFGTLKIEGLMNYAAQGFTPYNVDGFPLSTAFLGITVRRKNRGSSNPANSDPSIALALARAAEAGSSSNSQQLLGDPKRGISAASIWNAQAGRMNREGRSTKPWFANNRALVDEMSYQCDTALGTPSVVDCTQVEWNQLGGPPSDTLTVGPGTTRFLHSNTCYIAISAAVSVVLTWAQIRAAVETLMNVCLQTPFQVAQGGRAYYVPPPRHQVSGRKKVRREEATDVSGLNALPPRANITLFEQKEAWINSQAELTSCTWEAVVRDLPVSSC